MSAWNKDTNFSKEIKALVSRDVNFWHELRALRFGVVASILLSKYVRWEKGWYRPKNKFVKGDRVRYNWRYRHHLLHLEETQPPPVFVVDRVDAGNAVITEQGERIDVYWLTHAT